MCAKKLAYSFESILLKELDTKHTSSVKSTYVNFPWPTSKIDRLRNSSIQAFENGLWCSCGLIHRQFAFTSYLHMCIVQHNLIYSPKDNAFKINNLDTFFDGHGQWHSHFLRSKFLFRIWQNKHFTIFCKRDDSFSIVLIPMHTLNCAICFTNDSMNVEKSE